MKPINVTALNASLTCKFDVHPEIPAVLNLIIERTSYLRDGIAKLEERLSSILSPVCPEIMANGEIHTSRTSLGEQLGMQVVELRAIGNALDSILSRIEL